MSNECIDHMDEDFLGNKINIGDTVIFEAPGYRCFTIGKVITKAPKSCQIEYVNDWNYPTIGRKEVVRQAYDQIIKQPAADVVEVRHGEWLSDYETFVDDSERESEPIQTGWACSLCGRREFQKEPYCHCGAKMDGKGD